MEFKQDTLERQQTPITLDKSAKLEEGQFLAILSTDGLDRHGERVSQTGLVIPKGQVIKMYYNHETNGANLPIGKWNKIYKKDGKLWGLGEIDMEDEFAVKVYKKILKGIIDSISIGFYPQEYDGESSTWTKSTLVEASVVAEPANVEAVITSKTLGFTQEEFKQALKVKLKAVKAAEPFTGVTGTPPKEIVQDPATYDLVPPAQSEPVIDSNSPEANSEAGAVDTELKTAFDDLKSRLGAVEETLKASAEVPATKLLIKLRGEAKQVDKAADELNKVLRIKLKGQ